MALQNELGIVNSALRKLGANEISALTDTTKQAQVMSTRLVPATQAVLRNHTWNFATKRRVLETYVAAQTFTSITLSSTSPVRITKAAHGYATGDRIYFTGVLGTTELNGNSYNAVLISSSVFDLEGTDSSDFTAYTSAGTMRKVPAFHFTYLFALPSDCLRLLPIQNVAYRVEGRYIATDETSLEIKYIQDIDLDDQTADPLFAEALSTYLAWDACVAITESNTSKQALWQDYISILRHAKFANATEGGHQQVVSATTFDEARFGFNHGQAFPFNG